MLSLRSVAEKNPIDPLECSDLSELWIFFGLAVFERHPFHPILRNQTPATPLECYRALRFARTRGGGANDTAPAHATGVIRPSETAFVLALAISLAAYPTGKIQSSDKSEHSIEASLGSGPVLGRHVEHRLDLDGAEGPNSWDRPL
jgi:hypothetical protein